MIVDHCSSAVLVETIDDSVEDRSNCDFQATVPGEKFLLAPLPVQLGGRISPRASYPSGLTSTGFVGCIKNLIHSGEVCSVFVLFTLFEPRRRVAKSYCSCSSCCCWNQFSKNT